MRNRLNIIVVVGLAINMIAGASNAANQNPWAMYGGQKSGNTGTVRPRLPQQPQFGQQRSPQAVPRKTAPRQFNYEYAPLPNEQRPATQRQPQPYGQYQQQPYGTVPGFGFQMPVPFYGQNYGQGYGQGYGNGNLGGQFGFGMNFAPNFGASAMPFGFGMPTIPFFGGNNNYGVPNQGQFGNPYGNQYGNPYGNPYGRINPWGMGFPMF